MYVEPHFRHDIRMILCGRGAQAPKYGNKKLCFTTPKLDEVSSKLAPVVSLLLYSKIGGHSQKPQIYLHDANVPEQDNALFNSLPETIPAQKALEKPSALPLASKVGICYLLVKNVL